MNVLALQGSPRRDGHTQALLDLVLAGAEQAGATTETIHIAELKNLEGCRECYACQSSPDEPACATEDDMQVILQKVLAARRHRARHAGVLLVAGLGPLKMVIDRDVTACSSSTTRGMSAACWRGQKLAGVITAGGGPGDGADLTEEVLRRFALFSNSPWAGAVVAPNVKGPRSVTDDAALAARARQFGAQLVTS